MTPHPGAAASHAARSPLREIARSALLAIARERLRSGIIVASVAAMLLPLVAAAAMGRGLEAQARQSVAAGAAVHVTGERFGRAAPIPLAALERIASVPGVTSVEPRIVAPLRIGAADEPAVLVGISPARLAEGAATLSAGRMPRAGGAHELVVGSALAARLGLAPGTRIPPFYASRSGERTSEVVGVFRSDLPVWQSHVVVASLEDAAAICDQEGFATQALVECAKGDAESVAAAIRRLEDLDPAGTGLRPRAFTAADFVAALDRNVLAREGLLGSLCAAALALAVPLLLVTAGLGLAERRRETALLRAQGWRADEVLLRAFVESAALGAAGAALAVLLAFAWLRFGDAAGIAPLFFAGSDVVPGFRVPFEMTPVAAGIAFAAGILVTTTGSLWAARRVCSAPPVEAMR